MSKALVIPCYNEAERLRLEHLEYLLANAPDLHILLVDDGSTDGTKELLGELTQDSPRLEAMILPHNMGKAEAVRRGLLHVLAKDHAWVGYADADFATPAHELVRLMDMAEKLQPEVLIGSRVLLLGTDIERTAWRHYLGRVFASMASIALRLPIYDTQCGAKFFKATQVLRETLREPFQSRWVFDVEFIGRFTLAYPERTRTTFIEAPLQEWTDVKGSKLKLAHMARAAFDLLMIGIRLRQSSARIAKATKLGTV